MPEAMTNLDEMLQSLDVSIRPDLYVFAAVPAASPAFKDAHASVVEDEAMTLVIPVDRAREHGLAVGTEFAWLTLTIHSSLEAVGLTAAFSSALAAADISCNVLAGFYHDHLLVPCSDRDRAVGVLQELRRGRQGALPNHQAT